MPVSELVKKCLLDRLEELSNEKKQKQEESKSLDEQLLGRDDTKENGDKEYDE